MKKNNSFTLIEMLVVILVIMILATIILTIAKNMRERGREVLCKGNLKQLHTAVMNYVISSEGFLPPSRSREEWIDYQVAWHEHDGWIKWAGWRASYNINDSRANPGYYRWWGKIGITCIVSSVFYDYTGQNSNLYLCPTFALSQYGGSRDPYNVVAQRNALGVFTTNRIWYSYVMNSQISEADLSQVKASRRLLFGEMTHTNYNGATKLCNIFLLSPPSAAPINEWDSQLDSASSNEVVGFHHSGKSHVIFCDGHVEKIAPTQTIAACAGNL